MLTFSATFKVVTPMFLSGANSKEVELRPTAFKAELRRWWRALNWARIRKLHNDDASALIELHKQESSLFGSAAKEGVKHRGQSNVLLRLRPKHYANGLLGKDLKAKQGGAIAYLLGIGITEESGHSYIVPNQEITIEISLKKQALERRLQLEQAIYALGLLGGVGARSGRGFGSLSLTNLCDSQGNTLPIPKDFFEYKQKLKTLFDLGNGLAELPPFSAVSDYSLCHLSCTGSGWQQAASEVGRCLQLYRSWGKNGAVNGVKAIRKFPEDRHIINEILQEKEPIFQPKRLVFGIPHNYYFSSRNKKVNLGLDTKDSGSARRASPLNVHFHQIGSQVVAVQWVWPAQFAPTGADLMYEVVPKGQKRPEKEGSQPFAGVDWSVIWNYIGQTTYHGSEGSTRGFSDSIEVFRGAEVQL